MSAARRGLRNTWRWPTDGFSASRPAGEQRLADRLRERAGRCRRSRARGARSRCGSRPTCPSRRGAGGSAGRRAAPGRGPRAGAARALPSGSSSASTASSCSSTERGVGRAAAEPRDRLGDPQRVPRADRLAQLATSASTAPGTRERARRAGGRSAPAWSSKASGTSSSSAPGVERRRGQREHEEARRARPRAIAGRRRVAGRARLGEVDERADDGGHEQPVALGAPARGRRAARRGAGVAASSRPPSSRDRDLDRRAVAGARRAELARARARSAASSSARSCAVAAGGAPAPPASASAAASALMPASIAAWNGRARGVAADGERRRARAPSRAARWRRTSSTSIRAASLEREAADAGAEGDERRGCPRRARRPARASRRSRARMHVGRRRPAQLHRRRMDHPAARHLACGRLDRLAEADRRLLARLALERRPARRGAIAPATPPPCSSSGVGRVGDRVDRRAPVMSVSSASIGGHRLYRYRA